MMSDVSLPGDVGPLTHPNDSFSRRLHRVQEVEMVWERLALSLLLKAVPGRAHTL